MKINTLVRYVFLGLDKKHLRHIPFTKDDTFVYLGDIVQMPGHCIVIRMKDGKVFCGYHTEDFVEIPEEEA